MYTGGKGTNAAQAAANSTPVEATHLHLVSLLVAPLVAD